MSSFNILCIFFKSFLTFTLILGFHIFLNSKASHSSSNTAAVQGDICSLIRGVWKEWPSVGSLEGHFNELRPVELTSVL